MAIITTFSAFRDSFATSVSNPYSVTFSAPDFVDDAAANFADDGFLSGMRLQVIGSASNDGYRIVDTVAITRITTIEQTIAAEGPVAVTLTGIGIDNDGFSTWPVALVRSGGFSGGFTGLGSNYNGGVTLNVTINAQAADAVKGTDEYNWYLSQRTDVVSRQVLSVTKFPDTGTQSFSGTIRLDSTGVADGIYGSLYGTPDKLALLFNKCHLYVERLSDGAIQWIDLYDHYMTV